MGHSDAALDEQQQNREMPTFALSQTWGAAVGRRKKHELVVKDSNGAGPRPVLAIEAQVTPVAAATNDIADAVSTLVG